MEVQDSIAERIAKNISYAWEVIPRVLTQEKESTVRGVKKMKRKMTPKKRSAAKKVRARATRTGTTAKRTGAKKRTKRTKRANPGFKTRKSPRTRKATHRRQYSAPMMEAA